MPSDARAGRVRSARRPAPGPLLPALALTALAAAPAGSAQVPTAAEAAATTTIESVVAVVDGRPLLLSDRRALERVRGLAEAAALEALIDARLMQIEASRLPQAEVQRDEEDKALASLVERKPQLARDVPDADLRRLVRRELAILKYVEFRFRPQLRVSDAEVRAAFEGDPGAGSSWEEARPRLRERLERRALDERVEAWVRELRARAAVRYVGPAPAPR
jgi:hypothetical protein